MDKRGTSLMEVIVYVALFTGIITAVIAFTLTIINIQNKGSVVRQMSINVNTAVNDMAAIIRQAVSLNKADSLWDVPLGKLSLTMPAGQLSPVVMDVAEDTGQLRLTIGANEPIFLTPPYYQVDQFTVTDIVADKYQAVRLFLSVSANSQSDRSYQWQQSATITVKLRP